MLMMFIVEVLLDWEKRKRKKRKEKEVMVMMDKVKYLNFIYMKN